MKLDLIADKKSSSLQSKKFPGGGPPLLFIKMSGSGQACNKFSLVDSSSIAPKTELTLYPLDLNSSSVFLKFSSFTPLIIISTPSFARDSAQALPNPLLEAQTIAFFSEILRSN